MHLLSSHGEEGSASGGAVFIASHARGLGLDVVDHLGRLVGSCPWVGAGRAVGCEQGICYGGCYDGCQGVEQGCTVVVGSFRAGFSGVLGSVGLRGARPLRWLVRGKIQPALRLLLLDQSNQVAWCMVGCCKHASGSGMWNAR